MDGFEGTEQYQQFNSAVFLRNDDAPRIAHVHGAITYGITEGPKTFVKNIGELKPRRVPLWTPRLDGSLWTAIVTGADKPNKLVLPPYAFYYAWLANALLDSPKIMVIGYGVGDVHIKAWLAYAAAHHRGSDFRMVIVSKFTTMPPRNVFEIFAFAAGFEGDPYDEPALQGLNFADGITTFGGAMLVNTGMPLAAPQLAKVLAFLL